MPLTIPEDVEQWRRAAEQNLPNMRADHGQYALHAVDDRPGCLRALANAVTAAAEQGSPRLVIKDLPADGLPQSICRLPHLQELSIIMTECKRLPDAMGDLSSLTTLRMGGNGYIKRLPDSITKLDKLTTLQSTAMPLEALPQEIGNLRALTVLQLSGGSYQQLPQGFTTLSALKELALFDPHRGRELQGLPDDIGRLQSLQKLNLGNQRGLHKIPDSLTELHRLRELNLAGCSLLRDLPPHLGQLQSLKTLSLKHNEALRTLPESLGNLAQLKQLNLAQCKNLQALPPNIGNLQRLQKLDLSGCTGLWGLPDSLARLPPQCVILVPPGRLQARLAQLRPQGNPAVQPPRQDEAAARPMDRPRRPVFRAQPDRPIHRGADARITAWKERLAPFAHEEDANRFSQWLDAVSRHGAGSLSAPEAAQMERLVQTACTSPALRGKLNAFASTHVQLRRNLETGVTMTHIPPTTFANVRALYDVYVQHMVSDPQLATPAKEAHALMAETVRERFRNIPSSRAIRQMAGSEPTGSQPTRLSEPWPALNAYVVTHDPEGRKIAKESTDQLETLSELSRSRDPTTRIDENAMLQGHDNVLAANKLRMHERLVAVAAELLAAGSIEQLTDRRVDQAPALNPARR